jgi:prophage regulatory protein
MAIKIFLDINEAAEALSISDSSVEKLTREDPTFPRPRKITARRVGYLVSEIADWAGKRPVSDLLPPPNTGASKGRGVKKLAAA